MSALAIMKPKGPAIQEPLGPRAIPSRVQRKAYPRDVKHADLSRTGRQVYRTLSDYANDQNLAWPSIKTLAGNCVFSVRTAQRGIQELRARRDGVWICTPAQHSVETNAVVYHLHPDGKPCGAQQIESHRRDKRPDVSALNKLRWERRRSPLKDPATHDKLSCCSGDSDMTKKSSRHDKNDIAYKEELLRTTQREKKLPVCVAHTASKSDPAALEFFVEYTRATGVSVNGIDREKTEREWSTLTLTEQIEARNFIPHLIDGRPPNKYKLPQNYLADRVWTRTPLLKPAPEAPRLTEKELLAE